MEHPASALSWGDALFTGSSDVGKKKTNNKKKSREVNVCCVLALGKVFKLRNKSQPLASWKHVKVDGWKQAK